MSTVNVFTDTPDWTPEQVPGGQVLINILGQTTPTYNSGVLYCGHVGFLDVVFDTFGVNGNDYWSIEFYADSAGNTSVGNTVTWSNLVATTIIDRVSVQGPFFRLTHNLATSFNGNILVFGKQQGNGPLPQQYNPILFSAIGMSCAVGNTVVIADNIVPGMAWLVIYSGSANLRVFVANEPNGAAATAALYGSPVLAAYQGISAPLMLATDPVSITIANSGTVAAAVHVSLISTRGYT